MTEDRIDSAEFERLLIEEFPELRDEIRYCYGLDHLKMMEFMILTKHACAREDWKVAERCLRLADRLLRFGNSEIQNAVYVSYLELLPVQGQTQARLRNMMTPELRQAWDDILDYLSKLGPNID